MKHKTCSIRAMLALLMCAAMLLGLFTACGNQETSAVSGGDASASSVTSAQEAPAAPAAPEAPEASEEASALEEASVQETPEIDHGAILQDTEAIESALNLANNPEQSWTYSADYDAWTLSVVTAVLSPEIPDQEGVSVNVPGAYVVGIDTDGDGEADAAAADAGEDPIFGSLVIDYTAEVISSNGQHYTAATAPCILNTGAAGYSSSGSYAASGTYAAEGYINIACGNRGKMSSIEAEDGTVVYTGDAPCCLCDQKAATRFVKYNILLGNLPGSVDYWVSTGGSGGAAHATMFAATSNNPDFYDYQIAVGAVGVYQYEDGSYSTAVVIDGEEVELSDGAWGSVAYSTISSLAEGDIAMAFEYYLDPDYTFATPFQKKLAGYLAEDYMQYINDQNLTMDEALVGFDLDGDGKQNSVVPLTIEFDEEKYPDTNGYGGTYLNLYLAEFQSNLEWYLANLDYAEDWTWFDADGVPLSDEAVAAMTGEDRALAFIEGRYTAASTGFGGPGGPPPGGMGPPPDMLGGPLVGTPDAGTSQSASGGTDSRNYATYEDMLSAYEADVDEVLAGDIFGKNQVELYNPLNYIGAEGTLDPTWSRIMMGASEGDMSLMNSLNISIAMLNAGVDFDLQWQWNGGHVPSEIFGESLVRTVDSMYAIHVSGTEAAPKAAAAPITANGDSEEASGKDISSWVTYDAESGTVEFSLRSAAAYRTAGAAKAVPGFDVMDYGQEDYVFGSPEKDARHWNARLLAVLKAHRDDLEPLFNAE